MATPRVKFEIEEIKTTRVRFGRAALTIARSGDVSARVLSGAVGGFERGDLSASQLCQRFVRSRIRRHSPTFDWAQADEARLLQLVIKNSDSPQFLSAEPDAVAQTLSEAIEAEFELAWENLRRLHDRLQYRPVSLPALESRAIANGLNGLDKHLWALTKPLSLLGSGGAGFLDHMRVPSRPDQRLQLTESSLLADSLRDLAVQRARYHEPQGLIAEMVARPYGGLGKTWAGDMANRLAPAIRKVTKDSLSVQLPDLAAGVDDVAGLSSLGAGALRVAPQTPFLSQLTRISDQMASFLERMDESLPANWRELERDELSATVEMMKSEGLSLAWAPRAQLVRDLISADSEAARNQMLIERGPEIVADVESVLDEIDARVLARLADTGHKVIAAYADGHLEAAQALVGIAITEMVHNIFGFDNFAGIRQKFGDVDPFHDVGYHSFPLFAVGRVLVYAVRHIKDAGTGFNRNTTLHLLGPHYNEANLLAGLLLLTGLLREAQSRLAHQNQRELVAA